MAISTLRSLVTTRNPRCACLARAVAENPLLNSLRKGRRLILLEDVTVSVVEPLPGDSEVLRETHPHEKVEAHTLRYRIPVPKEGAAKLAYRVRVRF